MKYLLLTLAIGFAITSCKKSNEKTDKRLTSKEWKTSGDGQGDYFGFIVSFNNNVTFKFNSDKTFTTSFPDGAGGGFGTYESFDDGKKLKMDWTDINGTVRADTFGILHTSSLITLSHDDIFFGEATVELR